MLLEKITKEQWADMSENAHQVVFSTYKPVQDERIDFALLVVNNATPQMYVTCVERDGKSLYWQFGGAFPGARNTSMSFTAYQLILDWCEERYDRVTCLIENDNLPMLKFALAGGFRCIGIRTFKDKILLEHLLEFEKGE